MDKITIGASWDGRAYYPVEYINRLYNACCRNTTVPFDFVLYVGPEAEQPGRTKGVDPAIRIIPVGLPYWWCGIPYWQQNPPGIETRTILYLDIDQVIVGSLDDLIIFPSEQAYMTGYPSHSCPSGMERATCASTALLRNGAGHKVWDEYVKAGMPTWDPTARLDPGRPLPLACQSILDDPKHGIAYDLFPENWICSYKLEVLKFGLPEDCRIVAFHGQPKQAACNETWIKEHWR